jgi:signal transduction histidine kinase
MARDLEISPDNDRLFRYAAAAGVTAVAYALQLALWHVIPPSPQLLFYPAVFVAARIGGSGPGIAAALLSCLAMAHSFLPPEGSILVTDPGDLLDVGIFLAVAVGISVITGRLRAALARERAAAERAVADKNATDATWSMIAHDLRSPLSVITLGSAELGRRLGEHVEAEGAQRVVHMIRRSSDRARDLVQDALDAMRATSGALRIEARPTSLEQLCSEVVLAIAPLAERKGITVECEVTSSSVLCDPRRIEQVLSNLLDNAVKFTPIGGTVKLSATLEEGRALLSVTDTGSGISIADRDAIFEKYWTSGSAGGTGLGLWMARAFVEAHGASLFVEGVAERDDRDDPGGSASADRRKRTPEGGRPLSGTRFAFSLPLAAAESGPRVAGPPPPQPRRSTGSSSM